MRKNIIIVNGAPRSGKSSLGKALGFEIDGSKYYQEIGYLLRCEVQGNDKSIEFDRKVLEGELLRDKQLLVDESLPIVETWHTGNMAFVLGRNPNFYETYKSRFVEQLKSFNPVNILIEASWSICKERKGPVNSQATIDEKYFRTLHENIKNVYKQFELDYFIVKNEASLENAKNIVLKELQLRSIIW